MTPAINPIVYPVKDLAKAKELYRALCAVDPYVDEPYYVGFRMGEQELGLDPNGHKQGVTSPIPYWSVDDIQPALQKLLEAGATTQQEPHDVGGGMLVAVLRDADGNLIGLRQSP